MQRVIPVRHRFEEDESEQDLEDESRLASYAQAQELAADKLNRYHLCTASFGRC
jgi:hypothetical protein